MNILSILGPAPPFELVTSVGGTPMAYQQITDLSAATGLTYPAGSRVAIVQAEDQTVRYRTDGEAPEATVGMTLAPTEQVKLHSFTGDLVNAKFIEEASGGKLNVTYY